MTKKKKSAKQRRVLIVAVIVAIAIVAGSTFAWFTSKDEVTNRLSASADYNVAIAEDFQSPEEWIPGQTINKDVSAVNTGSVDAFVRMWLGGQLKVLNKDIKTAASYDVAKNTFALPTLSDVTDVNKTKLGLTYFDEAAKVYYKTLSTERINNPKDTEGHSDTLDEDTNIPARFSEVQTVQAAGVLVYAPADAYYTWELEQASDMKTYNGGDPKVVNLPKGTLVGTVGSAGTGVVELAGTTTSGNNYYGSIDADTFKPQTTGLYLFRRNYYEENKADVNTADKYEYSGYYYDSAKDVYFALNTVAGNTTDHAIGNSDYVLPKAAVNDQTTAAPTNDQVLPVTLNENYIYLYTATETLKNTEDLTWTYSNTAGSEKFTVTNGADPAITIDIALANIGTDSEQWTAIKDDTKDIKTTFYYNNDVEAGDTTTKLVDSVTLDGENTKNGSYLAFDFDLNVFMESVQVTMNEAGVEGYDTVNAWTATADKNVGASGADNGVRVSASEIEKITWTKAA